MRMYDIIDFLRIKWENEIMIGIHVQNKYEEEKR